MSAYTVRPAAPADAEAICALLTESELSTHAVLAAGTRYWLAQHTDGQIIGCIGIEDGAGAVLVRSATVRPDARGQGIGAALLQQALSQAAAAGCRRAYLFSTDAGSYWSRQGFREVPVHELVTALPDAPQVRHYDQQGWLPDEMAWCIELIVAQADA